GRSEQLYDATTQHARDLAARSAELAETQRQLVAAMQRQGRGDERPTPAARLAPAKDLSRHAAEQLRGAIYALNHAADELPGPLPLMLQRLSTVHRPTDLHVQVMLEGDQVPLPAEAEQSVLRWTGEALFNAATHGKATRAVVRLRYQADAVA